MADAHGNMFAEEGCDRCTCGAKYWEHDVCVSCGTAHPDLAALRARAAAAAPTFHLYGGVYTGTRGRPNANPVLALMRDDDLTDPWGTAMGWAFAVCDYLHHVALSDDIPESLGYSPGPMTPRGEGFHDDEDYASRCLVDAALDTYTLTQAAVLLSRYLDWVKAAGRDY